MKKILSILLIIMMVFTCSACSVSSTNQADTNDNEDSTTYTLNNEEETLAKLLIICSQTLKDPLSTKIKNVWTYKSTSVYYYTFEIESKNGYGNMVTEYHGGMIIGTSITEEVLNDIDREISLTGQSLKFSKDHLAALQNGTQLSSQTVSAMQDYFIKNYHD